MTIKELKTKRESLSLQIREIDTKISELEKEERNSSLKSAAEALERVVALGRGTELFIPVECEECDSEIKASVDLKTISDALYNIMD